MINSHRLKDPYSWEDEEEVIIHDFHWMKEICQSQEKEGIAELRKEVDAGKATKYLIQED